jgi:gamma-glutamyltranspeptidase / glutathione hydrolase
VNFRETAPLAASAGMFVGPEGEVDRQRATRSLFSVAVPGSPAGLLLSHRCYGRLSRATVMAPAIRLASSGFPLGKELADSLRQAMDLRSTRRSSAAPPATPPSAKAMAWPAPTKSCASMAAAIRSGQVMSFMSSTRASAAPVFSPCLPSSALG